MAMTDLETLYREYIHPLPYAERLKLLARVAQDLAEAGGIEIPAERSLLELEGLGADTWAGIDPQEYVDELRGEWRGRP